MHVFTYNFVLVYQRYCCTRFPTTFNCSVRISLHIVFNDIPITYRIVALISSSYLFHFIIDKKHDNQFLLGRCCDIFLHDVFFQCVRNPERLKMNSGQLNNNNLFFMRPFDMPYIVSPTREAQIRPFVIMSARM